MAAGSAEVQIKRTLRNWPWMTCIWRAAQCSGSQGWARMGKPRHQQHLEAFMQHVLARGARFSSDQREQSRHSPFPTGSCHLQRIIMTPNQCCGSFWFTKSFQQHSEVGRTGMKILSTLEAKKPRLREVTCLAQGHTASKDQSRDPFRNRK